MEDFDENDEMAAMMGFSSFGGAKKRKFDQAESPKAKDEYSASGANSTELGVRTKVSSHGHNGSKENVAAAPSTKQKVRLPPSGGGLASFLARGQALPEKPSGGVETPHETVPQTDSSTLETLSFGGPSISRADLNALKFGIKNENGDTAYFLPSFVEDPWDKLLANRN
ncbi:hypothetical protein N0V94_007632 [Neodidymelliopsis sp. IMI 364377]|nr:hypothetical protein N0V94_007632 [Neodidymelliopsis sp. IMI 364377]